MIVQRGYLRTSSVLSAMSLIMLLLIAEIEATDGVQVEKFRGGFARLAIDMTLSVSGKA